MKYELGNDYTILLFPRDFENRFLGIESVPRNPFANQNVKEIIDEEWDKYSLRQISLGKHDYLTNTSLFRYENYNLINNDIVINVSQTNYKEVYGTNIKHPEIYHEFGSISMGNALGICCLIETKDSKYLIFKRSDDVLELPGYYHLCAGHFERGKDTIENRPNVIAAIKREIEEELSIKSHQIDELEPIGLCESLISHKPEMLFKCQIGLYSNNISNELCNFENKKVLCLDEKELVRFLLKNQNIFVPSGKANIICYFISKYGMNQVNELLTF